MQDLFVRTYGEDRCDNLKPQNGLLRSTGRSAGWRRRRRREVQVGDVDGDKSAGGEVAGCAQGHVGRDGPTADVSLQAGRAQNRLAGLHGVTNRIYPDLARSDQVLHCWDGRDCMADIPEIGIPQS